MALGKRSSLSGRGGRILTLLLAVIAVGVPSARAQVEVVPSGKGVAGVILTSGDVDITLSVNVDMRGGARCAEPLGDPVFALDLYDDDNLCSGFDDCKGVDRTDGSARVSKTRWTLTGTPVSFGTGTRCVFVYKWRVPSFNTVPPPDCDDDFPFGAGDPRIEVTVGLGSTRDPVGGTVELPVGGTVDVGTPGVPAVGLADVGVTGPSRLANSSVLSSQAIAAFSRGQDEISTLGRTATDGGAALYLATDRPAQTASNPEAHPGRALVLDSRGQVWDEDVYAGLTDPGQLLGSIRYLNLNTGTPGASSPTTEMFFVGEGSDEVRYTATSDLASTSTYVDLETGAAVTALAVEDRGTAGLFDAGDLILYTVEGSNAIFRLAFGGSPEFLVANGFTFDGNTRLNYDYLGGDPARCSPDTHLGNVTALSVASLSGSQVTPADRIPVSFRDPGCDVDQDGEVDSNDLASRWMAADAIRICRQVCETRECLPEQPGILNP